MREIGRASKTAVYVNGDRSRIMIAVNDYDGMNENMSRDNAKELIRLLSQALWGKEPAQ